MAAELTFSIMDCVSAVKPVVWVEIWWSGLHISGFKKVHFQRDIDHLDYNPPPPVVTITYMLQYLITGVTG